MLFVFDRHSGACRNPGTLPLFFYFFRIPASEWGDEKPECRHSPRLWIPAFAGMTASANSE